MQFSYVVIPNTGVFSVYLMDLSFDVCTIPVVLRVGGLRFMYLLKSSHKTTCKVWKMCKHVNRLISSKQNIVDVEDVRR